MSQGEQSPRVFLIISPNTIMTARMAAPTGSTELIAKNHFP